MDIKSYLPLFIEESKDNIQQMSENLLKLEQDHGCTETVNEIFRSIHTIKGMSATMGYTDISNLAHQAENLLDEVRHDRLPVTPAMITGFLDVIDEFESQLMVLEQTGEPRPIKAERIQELIAQISQTRGLCTPSAPLRIKLEVFFSRDCMLRPARAIVILNQLAMVGDIVESVPPQEALPGLETMDKLECTILTNNPDEVRAVLEGGVEIESFSLAEEKEEAKQELDEPQEIVKPAEAHTIKNSPTVRVDTEKLDQLLNLVSELVINKTSLQEASSSYPVLADGVEHLHRLTGDLQTIVMNMRMIPLETVFNRFPRMIRDTAKALNKSVCLEIEGAETELDRTIIDDIADPLLHLLRNAVDHGIEPVDQRLRLGKSESGKIILRAYQTGNQVVIEVTDDGYGLDLDKIRAKARELGLWHGPEQEDLCPPKKPCPGWRPWTSLNVQS